MPKKGKKCLECTKVLRVVMGKVAEKQRGKVPERKKKALRY